MTEYITYAVRDQVGIISLNRPDKMNAINDDMADQIGDRFRTALNDPRARVLLVRAEGKSFCAGRDTTQLGHRRDDESDYHHVLGAQQRNLTLIDHAKPVVAAVQGHAIGGGFEIALAADIRVASDDAKIAIPEIKYGLLPDTGASQLLSALIGPSRTKIMMLTGRTIDAAQAERWGAVDMVVPRDELDDVAFALARDMASRPPIALAMGKQLANHLWNGRIREGIGMELLAQSVLFRTDDYVEARTALREKREPLFKGR
ncbi:enoyl-CoA hydratase/isomerase family protein (plasmid) [Sphingomonas paeninsulae]|jgi:enoyl-CoA hydratase|uniref:Enoyl-CoA hydratase/isomerase family protein n=1 Tax=Sphingomonas paeninsulae TaxID=2319844 RepID=A0A494THQ4_SPHPE|nr:enoyl-CoA hydratase/isomerase family protein [Sphingomonas paeninsulae]AYJ85376.1 enoyl-CoA hydratase/isomerase family protein [Sphingomonas paeninsulae]